MILNAQTYWFIVRHIATGEILPNYQRNGSTHWNPSTSGKPLAKTRRTPRLFKTLGTAKGWITYWSKNPNQEIRGSQTMDGWEEDYYEILDNRKASDLEILQVKLSLEPELNEVNRQLD